jgi:hypothetical protein
MPIFLSTIIRNAYGKSIVQIHEGVSKSFRTGCVEQELQMVQLQFYRYSVNQSSEFCRHNLLCCFLTSVYCCTPTFRYQLSLETFGYTLIYPYGIYYMINLNTLIRVGMRAIQKFISSAELHICASYNRAWNIILLATSTHSSMNIGPSHMH